MAEDRTICITGGNGFIGKALVEYFTTAGWSVRSLQHSPLAEKREHVEYRPFDLENINETDFLGAKVIIHTAYQPIIGAYRSHDINIDAMEKILAIAMKHGQRLIFLSTLSAHTEAESVYGKGKLKMESLCDVDRDLILKLGLVIGKGGGLSGRIAKVLRTSKIVPLLGGGQLIQTIALTDVCRVIEIGIVNKLHGTFPVAHQKPIAMRNLYEEIANKQGKHPLFIPLPITPVYFAVKFVEALRIPAPFTSENLLGLKCLRVFDTASTLSTFRIVLKDHHEALDEAFGISLNSPSTQ